MEAVCQNGEDRDQQNVLGTSGQKAAQKLRGELQAAGLAAPLCAVPQDGQGKDWSEHWRIVPDGDGVFPVIEAWVGESG